MTDGGSDLKGFDPERFGRIDVAGFAFQRIGLRARFLGHLGSRLHRSHDVSEAMMGAGQADRPSIVQFYIEMNELAVVGL